MKLPFANYIKAHHISHAALSVTALVAAIAFFVVGAGIRLLMGPVSLGPLAGTIADAIKTALPGITLKYDQAAIEWDRDIDRVNLVVLGARILDENGQIVAQAPKADIDLAAAPFLHGKFSVRRITLVGVRLGLVHMKNGGVRLGLESDRSGGGDIISRLNDVINAKGSNTSSLTSFAVRKAYLTVFDESTGIGAVAPSASLILTAKQNVIDMDFDSDVLLNGSHSPAHVKAEIALPPDKGPVTGSATVTHLDLRALGAQAVLFHALRNVALSLNLSTRFTVAPGAHLTRADFDVTGTGEIPLAALKDKALHVQKLRLTGRYDGVANHLTVGTLNIQSREAVAQASGSGDFHYDAQGALQDIALKANAGGIALNMPGVFQNAVGITSITFRGAWQAKQRQLDIAGLVLTAPGFGMALKGGMMLGPADQSLSPGFVVSGQFKPVPLATLMHYWPLVLAPNSREWIAKNIFAGAMGTTSFQTNIPVGMLGEEWMPDPAVSLTFPMSGVEANYATGLTHLTGVTGSATLLGDSFSAVFTGGHVGPINVTGGHAVIPAFHVRGTVGRFDAHADGAMSDIMTLIDMKPLGYPSKFHIDPKQTKGAASVDLAVTVPLLKDVRVADIGINVKAAVTGFALTLGSLHLTDGTVNFDVDNTHLHQTGTVQLADTRLAVDYTEDFNAADSITTRINAKGTLTEAARAALNIGLSTILTGPVPVTADLTGHSGELKTADVTLDLTPAVIAIPILNLGKAAGVAAGGQVTVNFAPGDVIADETIRLTGPNLSASGTASFDKTGALTVLNLPSVKMGPLNDLSVTLAHDAAGDDYTLRGHSLDGSMIGRTGSNSESKTASGAPVLKDDLSTPFRIDAKLDRVAMRDNVTIAPFALELTGVGERPSTLALSGSLSKTATITGSIEASPAGRKLTLQAGDAGQLLRGLFAFEGIRGGNLALAATLPGKASDADAPPSVPDFQGDLTITDFTLVHQPFLTRLFSAGSLTGMGDLLGGDGVSLEKLDVPFSSKNNVISVHDAIAHGRAIGATADGYIDRPKDQIALKGSLVPAYGLNSILGEIPLLGNVLVSKKGEGVFGVTYSATGNAEQPSISLNPLSVLTPGFLRRIFEGHIPNASNAPSNAPVAQGAAPAQ